MRKGPGFITTMYGWPDQLRRALRIRTPQPASKMGEYTLAQADYPKLELRVLAQMDMDFARAAGKTLAAVNADPRNHFGKHALRRFDND